MTREEFLKRWNSDENGGGITMNDIAVCAVEWGLCSRPKTMNIDVVTDMVLRAVGCED